MPEEPRVVAHSSFSHVAPDTNPPSPPPAPRRTVRSLDEYIPKVQSAMWDHNDSDSDGGGGGFSLISKSYAKSSYTAARGKRNY